MKKLDFQGKRDTDTPGALPTSPQQTGRSGRRAPTGTPRWVVVSIIIILVLILVFLILHLTGHGFGDHMHMSLISHRRQMQ